ncbi:MAG: hypothetical protein OHK0012_10110 [Synechococcales cyanobacterium]
MSCYGHWPYAVAALETLQVLASYGRGEDQRWEWGQPEVMRPWLQMSSAARMDGVWLVLVSAWRSWEVQDWLWTRQIERRGSPAAAARYSAPPGYSEHHSGYALDLADGLAHEDITEAFAQTPAYGWLTRFGGDFGFELSYPEGNAQGVAWEPWHWRFVGSATAVAVFAQARGSLPETPDPHTVDPHTAG